MRTTAEGGRTRIPVIVLVMLAALLLTACTGSGEESGQSGQSTVRQDDSLALNLRSSESADGRIRVELLASNASELYQLSSRLTFNPLAVKALGPASPGNLPDSDAIFYSNDRQAAYVPIAFSNRQAHSVEQSAGVIFAVDFERIDPALAPEFNLLRDPGFLIVRDNTGRGLQYSLEVQK